MSDPYPWLCRACGVLNYRPEGVGFRARFEYNKCRECGAVNRVDTRTRKARTVS